MMAMQAGDKGLQLLKRVLTAVVLIPIVLVLILKAPISVLAVIAAAVALLAVHDFLKLSEFYGIQPQRWPVFIYVGLFFLLLAINPGSTPLLETGSFSHSAIF